MTERAEHAQSPTQSVTSATAQVTSFATLATLLFSAKDYPFQLTWFLTPHSRTGTFASNAAAFPRVFSRLGEVCPQLTGGTSYF
jgi:hypothetical protein